MRAQLFGTKVRPCHPHRVVSTELSQCLLSVTVTCSKFLAIMSRPLATNRVSKPFRITPYIIGFMLNQEQMLKIALRFLSPEEYMILETNQTVISSLMSGYFIRKKIPRSFLAYPADFPDGSAICEYCYIFDCVPGIGGKHPRPTVDRATKAKIWEDIGIPDIPSKSIPCRCYRWPDLSPPVWLEDALSENLRTLVEAQNDFNKQRSQILAQSSAEPDKACNEELGGPHSAHPL